MSTTDHADRNAADRAADSCPEARIEDETDAAPAGFTCGPWFTSRKGGPFCVDATPAGSEPGTEDYRIAKTYASPFAPTQRQAAANARLIAAAPNLYAACKAYLTLLDDPTGPGLLIWSAAVAKQMRVAIARAEGRAIGSEGEDADHA